VTEQVRVWGPNVSRLSVLADGAARPLSPAGDGWWDGPRLEPGTDYAYLLDDDPQPLPDPASRWQPHGIHGSSRVYDQDAYAWQDAEWPGRDLPGAVLYELHIGTFTPGGTFDSAIARLDDLVALGITHIEPLPVNAVNGIWNWGYDGVGWYAVHEPLGGPDGFKRFVDAAHGHGLAVVLDVVYNHLGPSGNYLPRFGPYLKPGRSTWGELVNVEEPAVRRFIIENAVMWLRDYHVDGLRLDAVHALQDDSPQHILAELGERVAALQAEVGRPLTVIAESDLNDAIMVEPRPAGYGLDGVWDDDVHHALHAALTGERQGYYCDFGSLAVLQKVLTRAYLHDGGYSAFRGHDHGRPVDRASVAASRFVVTLQNHDQVGNRAVGDRLPELTAPGLVRVGAVLLLTAPFTPMLWMGEEWAASTRWPFFSSHPEPELAATTGPGRVEEFAQHGWDVAQMIDPQDPVAYRSAILDWSERDAPGHADVLELYRRLIALRARETELTDPDLREVRVDLDEEQRWLVVHRGRLRVIANLAGVPRAVPVSARDVLLATGRVTPGTDGTLTIDAQSAAVVRVA
jgi:maltooligosyltrehalose trehalohydrolase